MVVESGWNQVVVEGGATEEEVQLKEVSEAMVLLSLQLARISLSQAMAYLLKLTMLGPALLWAVVVVFVGLLEVELGQ